jgi:hypothetical protein
LSAAVNFFGSGVAVGVGVALGSGVAVGVTGVGVGRSESTWLDPFELAKIAANRPPIMITAPTTQKAVLFCIRFMGNGGFIFSAVCSPPRV